MNLEIFSKRLKELMEMEGESIRSLSIKMGVDRTSIRYWLKGIYFPKYDALIKLSAFFNVSVDYLVGLEENMDSAASFKDCEEISAAEISEKFVKKLGAYMTEKNLTIYAMSKELDIDQKAFTKWLRNGSMPSVVALIKLARLMHVPIHTLLGRE